MYGWGRKDWYERIVRKNRQKFLVVISNDNNLVKPEFIIKVWDITGYRHINSYNDFGNALISMHGPFPGEFKTDMLANTLSDGVVYPTMETAKAGLRKLWKDIV